MWDTVKGLIGSAAPMVGTLIGGPAGVMVGGLIGEALGCDATPQAIEHELKNNPDALLKLRKLDSDERITSLKDMYADRDSARDMNIKVQGSKDWLVRNTGSVLGLFTVLAAFGMDGYLLYLSNTPDATISPIFTLVAGGTSARAIQVLSFYFGDSKTSADNNKKRRL